MAADSKHYGDVKKWIEKVIDSCETHRQLNHAENLVDNFDKYLVDYVNPDFAYGLTHELRISVYIKSREITKI